MKVQMTQDEFDDKVESDTAVVDIFGSPFMLVYQSGPIDSDAECHLEFVKVEIVEKKAEAS